MDAGAMKKMVAAGYDHLSDKFIAWAESVRNEEKRKYFGLILDRAAKGSPVLELGCGPGGMITRALSENYDLTALDISPVQLEVARKSGIAATFICSDMADYKLPTGKFAAVVAFYSLFHLPRHEQPALFRNIHGGLKPGGWFVGCLGTHDNAVNYDRDFLGVEMVSSSFAPETNDEMVRQAGFTVESSQVETEEEFGRGIRFHWIVAQKV